MPPPYVTIRNDDLFGRFLGARVVDITQHDEDEWTERGCFVEILFDNGMALRIEDDPDGTYQLTLTYPEAAHFEQA